MNKSESKYFNTARRMDEALISLLEKKDFSFITVKDICGEAGVNRSTFYLHYETVADLLDETMEYLNSRFQSYFSETAEQMISQIPGMPLGDLVFIQDKYLIPYLTYIRENKAIFCASVKQPGTMQSHRRFEGLYHFIADPVMERFQIPEDLRGYYYTFYISGVVAVIKKWLKNGCRESPEEVSRIIEGLCFHEK